MCPRCKKIMVDGTTGLCNNCRVIEMLTECMHLTQEEHFDLTPEEEEWLEQLYPNVQERINIRDHLMKADPSQRQDMLDNVENFIREQREREREEERVLGYRRPKRSRAPARPTCAGCSSKIYGSYHQFKKPDGETADLCEACARPVRGLSGCVCACSAQNQNLRNARLFGQPSRT